MRVLYIPSWFPSTKNPLAGSFIKDLAADLADSEIEIIVAAFHQKFTDLEGSHTEIERISDHLSIHHHFGWTFPKINKFAQNSWIKSCIEDMEAVLEEYHFDFIHAHDYVSSFLAHKLSKQTNIPFICTMHHSDFISDSISSWRTVLLNDVFEDALQTIVPSEALKEAIEDSYELQDILLIPNYIDPTDIGSRKALPTLPERLIAVSSDEAVKNNTELIEFAEENQVHIDIYGELEKFLESTDYAHLKGKLPRKELLNVYKDYDGYISMSSIETFGLSILEALASGLPVMINNEYGSNEFVNQDNGLLISEDYNATWNDFKNQYSSYSSSDIRNNIIEQYSKEQVMEQYRSLYRKIYSSVCVA